MFLATLSDQTEMKQLLTVDGRAFVSYLTHITEKLSMHNKQLQGSSKTLVDGITKIFGFATFIKVCQKHLSQKI